MIHYGFKSKKAFSEKVRIPYTTIISMLTIGTNPGYDSLLKIISAFPEISLYWLILGENEMFSKNKIESNETGACNDFSLERMSELIKILENQQSAIHVGVAYSSVHVG